MGTRAMIGLGSNLGDRDAILDQAVASLAAMSGINVVGVSSRHETAPVGGPSGQGPFLNAAALLDVAISPLALHEILKTIEREAGRVRIVRWGERTLDLDLLLFGDTILDTPGLTIPHMRMAVRRFVLAPLAEIAPDAIDPVTGRSVADLLANLDRRPGCVGISASLCDRIEGAFAQGPAPRLLEKILAKEKAGLADWFAIRVEPPFSRDDNSVPVATVRPTFMAVDEGFDSIPRSIGTPILRIGHWKSAADAFSRRGDAEDREYVIAEILAACAASRSGCEKPST